MIQKQGRYSVFIRPIAYAIDLAIIIVFALQFQFPGIDYLYYALFTAIGWLFLSLNSNFYNVYRFTRVTRILSLSFLQIVLFTLIVFSFFGVFHDLERPIKLILSYIAEIFVTIIFAKLGMYFLLQRYRKHLGGNHRRTVIIGNNAKTRRLENFFSQNPNYGYQLKKTFDTTNKPGQNFSLEECFGYIINRGIDEIYCSIAELNNRQIKALINFADNNLKVLKFIPDNKEIYSKQLKIDYYDYLPILSLRDIRIDDPLNKIIKRIFDIVLSLIVIVCILSWLTPILAIFIKSSSKGPVFFRQLRNGLDYNEFYCYKFRSMRFSEDADIHQASRNDPRITRIGKFMRSTSIDELPQFFNVLLGSMSAVGPRPHMVSHTHIYANKVDKFMVRHFVKPGITGLAQVSGYRGEIETENDIINRVKYDIFYIENWSLLLDIKIIIQTIYNAVKGDKKAY